jgi:hypothetical protein
MKIAFKSTRTVMENDEVNVIGDLTLTLLERDATYNPGEDYAGPVYGEGVAHNITRQVVFVFPKDLPPTEREDRGFGDCGDRS